MNHEGCDQVPAPSERLGTWVMPVLNRFSACAACSETSPRQAFALSTSCPVHAGSFERNGVRAPSLSPDISKRYWASVVTGTHWPFSGTMLTDRLLVLPPPVDVMLEREYGVTPKP